jgi:hypothetical protein
MLTVVMVLEGVLRIPSSDGHYPTGWSLFHALAPNTRLYLLSHQWRDEECKPWLAKRNLTGHLGYIHQPIPGTAGRLEALQLVRHWHVNLVIEPDPACAAAELEAGWNTLLHTHTGYSRPEWRPDYTGTPRPWDDLIATIERHQDLRARDDRLKEPK